jgi:hypothetical protein
MMVISWFFWPSPAVALLGAVLLPVALRAGLPAHTLKKTYGSASPYVEFNLYEDDPVGDDFMGSNKIPYNSKTQNGIDCVFSNINDFVDGGVAELYTKHWTNYTTTSTVTVKYYD